MFPNLEVAVSIPTFMEKMKAVFSWWIMRRYLIAVNSGRFLLRLRYF